MIFNINPDKIKYIKMVYKDNSEISHYVKAAVKTIGDKDIFASAKTEDELFIKTPQEISLGIICEDGLYYADTTLKFVENKDSHVFFTIKKPDEIEYQQNREYFRVKIENDVLLSFDGTVFPCKIHDISANGICLLQPENIKIPEFVNLEILFSPKTIKTKAKYIRTDSEDDVLKASFYFINISESDRDLISQICIRKQIENRRNAIK